MIPRDLLAISGVSDTKVKKDNCITVISRGLSTQQLRDGSLSSKASVRVRIRSHHTRLFGYLMRDSYAESLKAKLLCRRCHMRNR